MKQGVLVQVFQFDSIIEMESHFITTAVGCCVGPLNENNEHTSTSKTFSDTLIFDYEILGELYNISSQYEI